MRTIMDSDMKLQKTQHLEAGKLTETKVTRDAEGKLILVNKSQTAKTVKLYIQGERALVGCAIAPSDPTFMQAVGPAVAALKTLPFACVPFVEVTIPACSSLSLFYRFAIAAGSSGPNNLVIGPA